MSDLRTFDIPVYWEMKGYVRIEAKTLKQAISIFDEKIDSMMLPQESYYIDDSFHREKQERIIKECNPPEEGEEIIQVNILELASELAEKELISTFSGKIFQDRGAGFESYTEEAQDAFNELYEKYHELISNIKE